MSVTRGLKTFSTLDFTKLPLVSDELKAKAQTIFVDKFTPELIGDKVNLNAFPLAQLIHDVNHDVMRAYGEGERRALYNTLQHVARGYGYLLLYVKDEGLVLFEEMAEIFDAIADEIDGED